MKRSISTLFVIISFLSSAMGQKLSSMEIAGVPSLCPLASLNPTKNDLTKVGTAEIIFPASADLTNVVATFNCGTTASIVEPAKIPADLSSIVTGIKVQNDGSEAISGNTDWVLYNLQCKKIKPATETFDLFPFDNKWTESTVGWAGAALSINAGNPRLESLNRSIVLNFDFVPDKLIYNINITTADATGGKLDVEESADGITWTVIHRYDDTNKLPLVTATATEKAKEAKLLPTSRYARFILLAKPVNANLTFTKSLSVVKLGPLGTEQIKAEQVSLYPVPANDVINITAPEAIKNVVISNITGQIISEQSGQNTQISVKSLLPGYYNALITLADGSKISKRFIRK